jgi:hypothetical protein
MFDYAEKVYQAENALAYFFRSDDEKKFFDFETGRISDGLLGENI